ncbi:MAG: Hpt domain-containing protein [Gammaproteobacteria bacterium]|nr:Hpt domain-containing protein [Gammaproteobacteria bacterium]
MLVRYHAALPGQGDELERLFARAIGAPAESAHLAAIGDWAHSLAGSAGLFGYAGLHDAALTLDDRIRDGLAGGTAFGPRDVRADVEALVALIARLAAGPPPATADQ